MQFSGEVQSVFNLAIVVILAYMTEKVCITPQMAFWKKVYEGKALRGQSKESSSRGLSLVASRDTMEFRSREDSSVYSEALISRYN